MTIAEVSKQTGLSPDTLRYYERIGLIPPVPRNHSGVRDYDQASLEWVEMMKCMRRAGVQIEALITYVSLFAQGEDTVQARKQILLEQREQLMERQKDLAASLALLNSKIEHYDQLIRPVEPRLEEQLQKGTEEKVV